MGPRIIACGTGPPERILPATNDMIGLEDSYSDVIAKAQRGLGLDDSALALKARLSIPGLHRLKGGNPEHGPLTQVAEALRLDAESLFALAEGRYEPEASAPEGEFAGISTPYADFFVNAYLVWQGDSGTAIAFDTGANCSGLLRIAKSNNVKIDRIFLTHTHPDHIAELRRLREVTRAPIFVSAEERILEPRTNVIIPGSPSRSGGITVTARSTPGHSPGGLTYVVEGLSRRYVIVGDALFAGSMGGVPASDYESSRKAIRTQILSLPDDSVVCPGHGPLTTVGLEKLHNPFFAGTASRS